MESIPLSENPWPAPAKLNRFLHIVGRRSDGYHLLQTVFQFIDRCDYLYFQVRSDGRICRQNEVPGISPAADLSLRAARLLQEVTGVARGATIRIDKRLPIGGGLGGGSADAATTLVALNCYWRTGLSLEQLAELGLRLGADVPVFVGGRAAWAEGVGERLTPLELDEPWFVVLVPPCSVATGAVFNDPKLTRDSQPITISAFMMGGGSNDCESVVYRHYPEVTAAAHWLSRYGKVRLTGTGGCVFAAFPDRWSAEQVADQIPTGMSGFVARGLNRSPLYERLLTEECGQVKTISIGP